MIVQRLASLFSKALLSALLLLPQDQALRFEVTSRFPSASGRLFVVIGERAQPEPRTLIDDAGQDTAPVLARDVRDFGPGTTVSLDKTVEVFPPDSLNTLEPGNYYV